MSERPKISELGDFDVFQIVGMDLDRAEKIMEKYGYSVRPVWSQGAPNATTRDFRDDRLNVATWNGKIIGLAGQG